MRPEKPSQIAPEIGLRRQWITITIGFLGAMLLFWVFAEKPRTEFKNLALGKETSLVLAAHEGSRIQCDTLEYDECLVGMTRRKHLYSKWLWLGNSQLHGINQQQPGDEPSPLLVAKGLRQKGIDLVTYSFPNASAQELLVVLEHVQNKQQLQHVIVEVCFDDFREDGIRVGVGAALRDSSVRRALSSSEIGKRIAESGFQENDNEKITGAVESMLDSWLTAYFPPWAGRLEAQGQFLGGLYRLRNFVFQITPTTKRKMIPSRYRENMLALEQLLVSAKSRNMSASLYIPPIRQDLELPYVLKEYDAFKFELQALANRFDARLWNYEAIVPGQYWGTKPSSGIRSQEEVDFMHFRGQGHRILADRILDEIAR